jgi:hypothetical protein
VYLEHVDFFSKHNVDLAVCDHFNEACIEASITSKIPFIYTSAPLYSPGKKKKKKKKEKVGIIIYVLSLQIHRLPTLISISSLFTTQRARMSRSLRV